MRWVIALKMWNMHKKIYDPTHVYAMPRKGTAEYEDVKHVQTKDALPAHLEKKAPFPAKALEQLREQEKAAKARSEVAKREKVIEKIAEVKAAARPVDRRQAAVEKENEQKEIERVHSALRNFTTYWPEHWKKSSSKEKLTAYNQLDSVLGAKLHKEGYVYKALKDELDSFEKPAFIEKGYKAWEDKGGKSDTAHVKGRLLMSDMDAHSRHLLRVKQGKIKGKAENVIEHAEAPVEVKVPKLPKHIVKKQEEEAAEAAEEAAEEKPKGGALSMAEKTKMLKDTLKRDEEALAIERNKKNPDEGHAAELERRVNKVKGLLKSGSY